MVLKKMTDGYNEDDIMEWTDAKLFWFLSSEGPATEKFRNVFRFELIMPVGDVELKQTQSWVQVG